MNISIARVLGATGIVLLTTLDDAVWLVPLVAQMSNRRTAVLHAVLFVTTLLGMAVTASLCTLLAEKSVFSWLSETGLTAVGVVVCWSLALFLLYKSIQKRKRKRAQREEQEMHETDSLVVAPDASSDMDGDEHQDESLEGRPRPWMVISLTFLGSLDEISYFPSLILGGILNAAELCIGTALAALVILVIVVVFLRQCKPLMDCLDRIPLYGVVALFASILSVELVWDILFP